jgi:hypothetical protein
MARRGPGAMRAGLLRDRVDMMSARPFLYFLTIAAMLLMSGAAFPEPVACPLILEEGAIKIVRPPTGWTATSHSLARLTGGGLMRGHPDQIGYLRAEKTTHFKGGGTASNEFEAGEEKWLWCGYGATNALQLSKQLPDSATQCTVTHRETKRDGITEIAAECR